MAVYKRGRVWWYKFTWSGEPIRESTKQSNKRVGEQMEAAHKSSLAKGEVGIRDRAPTRTLGDFAKIDLVPYIESHFADKPSTRSYYRIQMRHLIDYKPLAWEHVRKDSIYIPYGKTVNARREIPASERVVTVLNIRRDSAETEWVFPASTRSGHIEQSTPKKQHAKACTLAKLTPFVPYTFRHTCLTRWASILDPYTLAYLAGHSDFSTTKRYVHPNLNTAREALQLARKVQSGHKTGHSDVR